MAKVKVEAVCDFSNAQVGSREAGEQFDYDLVGDPAGLKAEGRVVAVKGDQGKPEK